MCGIVGVISSYSNGFSPDEGDAFRDMLAIDTFRGWDSTGVFGVDSNASVRIMKDVLHGYDFIRTEEFKKFRQDLVSRGLFAVGHNRAATRGSITDRNAHPFWVDDKIILVQNGTMYQDHTKLSDKTKEIEVDSEAIAHVLNDEPDIEKALQSIDSAYALVWFNTETETLNLIRNYARPLWIARHKNSGVMFASEDHTLRYAIRRQKILNYEEPEELKPGVLLQFKISGHTYEASSTALDIDYKGKKHYGGWTNQKYCSGDSVEHMGGAAMRPPFQERVIQLPHLTSNSSSEANRSNLIAFQFVDYASSYLPEFFMDNKDAHAVADTFIDVRGKTDGKLYIELSDFIEANKDQRCTAWHVWGSVMHPEDDCLIKVIAHWIVFDKTRAEIKEYTKNRFWCGESGALMKTEFSTTEGPKCLLKTNCHSLKNFTQLHNEELADEQARVEQVAH